MQFNSHATNQDLVTLAEKLTKSNSVSFPIKEKTLYANLGNRIIMSTIHEAFGGWKYDDSNETDLPIATTDLVSGQNTYSLPADSSFIDAVYVYPSSSSDWVKLEPKQLEDFNNEQEDYDTDGQPRFYRLIGDEVKLYPATNYASTAGLKIEYTRDISVFASSDTTKTPGFDSQFHEALAVYMAWQYAISNNLETEPKLSRQWIDIIRRLSFHYQTKWKRIHPSRLRVVNKTKQYM